MRWLIAMLFIISVNWRYPSVYKQISYVHTMECFSAVADNKQLVHVIMWMNLKNIMLNREARNISYLQECCSVTQSCPTLCNPLDGSSPGFPVLHHFPELAQTHVHWVSDAIQPSHPLSSPSPPAFNLSQHRSFLMSLLFASGGQSVGASASVLPMNIQDWFPLGLTGLISLQSKGLSRVFSNTTVQKHLFFSTQSSL